MKINPALKNLIPPLSDDEFNQLEKNILFDGIRDPLVVWGDVIVDGHNRFFIAKKHNLKFKTTQKEFKSEDEVKVWIIDNQSGRRNLNDAVRYELKRIKADILRKKGKDRMSEMGKVGKEIQTGGLSIVDKPQIEGHNTQKEIAKDLRWSTGKVAMADKVFKESDEETKQALREGKTTISKEYRRMKAKQGLSVIKKLKKQKEEIEHQIVEIEQISEKELNCYKITDSCYLVGEGSIKEVYKHLLNNLKFSR